MGSPAISQKSTQRGYVSMYCANMLSSVNWLWVDHVCYSTDGCWSRLVLEWKHYLGKRSVGHFHHQTQRVVIFGLLDQLFAQIAGEDCVLH